MPTTIVAIVNGMVGGTILVLPVLTTSAGWALALLTICVTGAASFFSCYIAVIHLGDQSDVDKALFRHFNGSKFMKAAYDFCVFVGLLLAILFYFELIYLQWQGLTNGPTGN